MNAARKDPLVEVGPLDWGQAGYTAFGRASPMKAAHPHPHPHAKDGGDEDGGSPGQPTVSPEAKAGSCRGRRMSASDLILVRMS